MAAIIFSVFRVLNRCKGQSPPQGPGFSGVVGFVVPRGCQRAALSSGDPL